MIGLGNDYLVNSEFAWTKAPSKNLLGYFPHSLRPRCTPQYRHNPCTPSLLAPHAASRGCMGFIVFWEGGCVQDFLGCLLLSGLRRWSVAGLGYSLYVRIFSRRMAELVNKK